MFTKIASLDSLNIMPATSHVIPKGAAVRTTENIERQTSSPGIQKSEFRGGEKVISKIKIASRHFVVMIWLIKINLYLYSNNKISFVKTAC